MCSLEPGGAVCNTQWRITARRRAFDLAAVVFLTTCDLPCTVSVVLVVSACRPVSVCALSVSVLLLSCFLAPAPLLCVCLCVCVGASCGVSVAFGSSQRAGEAIASSYSSWHYFLAADPDPEYLSLNLEHEYRPPFDFFNKGLYIYVSVHHRQTRFRRS